MFDRARLSAGVFAADVPRDFHGNSGWDFAVRGASLKWDYLGASQDGFFVGMELQRTRNRHVYCGTGSTALRYATALGIRGGYRMPIGDRGFFITPWVGVSYSGDSDDVVIDGETFEGNAITVFPTVHVGRQF